MEPSEPTARAPILQGPKRQHYLPEFYLNGFCRNGSLWLYDRVRKEYRQQQPRNTGVIGHLYTVRDDEDRQRFEIEAMLSKAEGAGAAVIRKLVNREAISAEERAAMALFAALAFTRTPERLREIEMLRAHPVEQNIRLTWGTPEGAARLLQEMPPPASLTGGEAWSPERLAEQINSGFLTVQIAQEAKIQDMLKMTEGIIPIFQRMTWIVLHAAAGKTFVTTDSPVRLVPPSGFNLGPYGDGFNIRGAHTVFPLSAAACMVMVNAKGPVELQAVAGRGHMRAINRLQAVGAYEYVIGRDEALVKNLVERLNLDSTPILPKLRID